MILADKIMNERKKNGWSQEELAVQLGVTRQMISGWETAQSIPDLQTLIKLSQIFDVSTDYLLKDEMENEISTEEVGGEIMKEKDFVRVSMKEANEYIACAKEMAPKHAIGSMLCILSPVTLIFLSGVVESGTQRINESLAYGVGVLTLFLMISIAAALFIISNAKMKRYEYLKQGNFETEYGIIGHVKELKAEEEQKSTMKTIVGTILCICCALPLFSASLTDAADTILIWMVCVLLCMIAAAVYLFTTAHAVNRCCDVLLKEGEYTEKNLKNNKVLSIISSVYWSIIVAIYLAWSFYTMDWGRSWIIWPIAGIFHSVISNIVKAA